MAEREEEEGPGGRKSSATWRPPSVYQSPLRNSNAGSTARRKEGRTLFSSSSAAAAAAAAAAASFSTQQHRNNTTVGGKRRPRLTHAILDYLSEEIAGDYPPAGLSQQKKLKEIYNFFNVPLQLEQLLLFGYFVCCDSFLFLFTFLPLRFFLALCRLFARLFSRRRLNPTAKYDLMRGTIFLVCCFVLQRVDVSVVYHYIRGQAIIKLYVIYNLLEIFDKLCCAFGQDIFDALFSRATEDPQATTHPRIVLFLHFIAALIYVIIHSLVLFFQVITLNVAINSHSTSLITLLVSNQFVELKGSVFKRFAKENLFQISCSDMVERFQLSIFLQVIMMHNVSDLNWDISVEWVVQMAKTMLTVALSEVLVDWIKHCFVTKFNHLSPKLYSKFYTILCSDIVASKIKQGSLDNNYAVSRRVGFIPLPLGCLLVRALSQVLPLGGFGGVLLLLLMWLTLVASKALIRVHLLAVCLRVAPPNKAVLSLEENVPSRSKASSVSAAARRLSFSNTSFSSDASPNNSGIDTANQPSSVTRVRAFSTVTAPSKSRKAEQQPPASTTKKGGDAVIAGEEVKAITQACGLIDGDGDGSSDRNAVCSGKDNGREGVSVHACADEDVAENGDKKENAKVDSDANLQKATKEEISTLADVQRYQMFRGKIP